MMAEILFAGSLSEVDLERLESLVWFGFLLTHFFSVVSSSRAVTKNDEYLKPFMVNTTRSSMWLPLFLDLSSAAAWK